MKTIKHLVSVIGARNFIRQFITKTIVRGFRSALFCSVLFLGANQLRAEATLLITFTNPTPVLDDYFGISVAAVGSDRVLIGAYRDDTGAANAGAAYLFSTNGTLLITFTNPTPAIGDEFGYSVAAVGSDQVLIGAEFDKPGAALAGAAYLFSTNGTLLTTFTNPTPADSDVFGSSVAAVGNDRVLIGAPLDDTGAADTGAAYLFSTNGTLLTTFTNPTPAVNDVFGDSVAAVGNDRVLIGASGDNTGATDAGAAYLFSTNGTLLTTFTNPTPALSEFFGRSVAALGNDRVLIGAIRDNTGAASAGAAYLFSTNGTLLTTFTNPTPADSDRFGISVAAVGSDRVLIGAYTDDTGATDAGAAYLFSTNGTLLTTFTNPTPAAFDNFGISVAAVGSDRVLIGAQHDNTGATAAGAAYLFTFTLILPAITGQPAHQTVSFTNGHALLSVSAIGAGSLSYQWQFNGTDISGATASTFALNNITVSDIGYYSVVITNSLGAVTSAPVTMSLFGIDYDNQAPISYAHLKLFGITNAQYQIDYQTNLNNTNWIAITNFTLPQNPYEVIDGDSLTSTQRFYRALFVP